MENYYESELFRERQAKIKAGTIHPRIIFVSNIATSFLKYSAQDFCNAAFMLDCESVLYLEGDPDNVYSTYTEMIEEFHPDILFMISHGRPSCPEIDENLPIVSHIQDCCGPIELFETIGDLIRPKDLLACQTPHHQKYIVEKGVPIEQTMLEVTPVDDKYFTPYESVEYAQDVSLVNHAYLPPNMAFQEFVLNNKIEGTVHAVFESAYEWAIDKDYVSEEEFTAFVMKLLPSYTRDNDRTTVRKMAYGFYIGVYYSYWRLRLIEELDQSGIDITLYGNRWDYFPSVKHLVRGHELDRSERNDVYNTSKINLHLNPVHTMHARVVECALAGAFVIVPNIPKDKDWSPVGNYFPDAVAFDMEDIVSGIEHYLKNEELRKDIAAKMMGSAVNKYTAIKTMERILKAWLDLL